LTQPLLWHNRGLNKYIIKPFQREAGILKENHMEIEKRVEEGRCVVGLKGRLDAVTAPELEKNLGEIIEDGNVNMILDLTGLEYVSSAGLRIFLVATKKVKALKGELCLVGLSGNIKEVIEISGFPSIMPCYDTMADLPSS
jgi:anti-anti-sigma factor